MQDLYESQYGIYNHLAGGGSQRPLASIALHPTEDINQGSLLEQAIRTYILKGIKDLYGLSLVEFLELPMDVVETLLTISGEEQSKKSTALASIEREFGK